MIEEVEEIRFKEYRSEFPLNTVKTWRDLVDKEAKWSYSGWTGEAKEPLRHWSYVIDYESVGIFREIWVALQEGLNVDGLGNLRPQRVLANLFNHGDSSWLHRDSLKSSDWTVILYLNEYWDIGWGGDTVLVEDNEILHCCAPMPGKMLLFRSDLLHGARPVSREALYPRFGLTYQCVSNS